MGERVVVEVGPVAHGGHCVARTEGQVVFVRHALPGERVEVELTEGDTGSRFLRGDVVEVLESSPDRVTPPCPYAGACGGCDFQHVSLPGQRALKTAVVREQLQRLAGIESDVEVEAVPGDDPAASGLGWRTRVQYAVGGDGRAGLRRHRSRDLVVLTEDDGPCRIAHPGLPAVADREWPEAHSVEAVRSSTGQRLRVVHRRAHVRLLGPEVMVERVPLGDTERDYEVTGAGFWQVHPGAARALTAAVRDALGVRPGERVLDLYCGVGLFAADLAGAVGTDGEVLAVESEPVAVADAERNLADLPQAQVRTGRVDRLLARGALGSSADVVILDPPRTGAKRPVVRAVAALAPRAVAYVACDPAALARDVAVFAEEGYRLASLRAFDLFPMTHHVECIGLLTKTGVDLR